jgi:hypothetical protein
VPPEEASAVRDALAVVETSAFLIRQYLRDKALTDDYLTKHLSRIEENVRRASVALDEE